MAVSSETYYGGMTLSLFKDLGHGDEVTITTRHGDQFGGHIQHPDQIQHTVCLKPAFGQGRYHWVVVNEITAITKYVK